MPKNHKVCVCNTQSHKHIRTNEGKRNRSKRDTTIADCMLTIEQTHTHTCEHTTDSELIEGRVTSTIQQRAAIQNYTNILLDTVKPLSLTQISFHCSTIALQLSHKKHNFFLEKNRFLFLKNRKDDDRRRKKENYCGHSQYECQNWFDSTGFEQ